MTPGTQTCYNNMEMNGQENSNLNVSDQDGPLNNAKEIKEDLEDIIKSNQIESREDKITLSLEYLREELIAMQQDDFSLLRQLLTINVKIRNLTSQQPNKSRSSSFLNRSSSFHLSPETGQYLYRQQSVPNGEFLGVPEDKEVEPQIIEEKPLSSSCNAGFSPVSSSLNVGVGSPLSGLSDFSSRPLPKSFRCRRSSSSVSDYMATNGAGKYKNLSHSHSAAQLRDATTRGSASSSVINGTTGRQMNLSHSLTAANLKDTTSKGNTYKVNMLDMNIPAPNDDEDESPESKKIEKEVTQRLNNNIEESCSPLSIKEANKKRPIKLTFDEYDYHSLPLKKTYSAPPKSPIVKNLQTIRDNFDAESQPSSGLSRAGSFPFLAFGSTPKSPYPKSQPTTPSHLTTTHGMFYETYLKKSSQAWKDVKRDEEEGIVDERKVNTLQMFM